MKTKLLVLTVCLLAPAAMAETASYGIRLTHWSWQENTLYGDKVETDGMAFGPTLLFRLDRAERWSLGLDGAYGVLDEMDRADVAATLGYAISSMFTVYADLRWQWFEAEELEGAEDADGTAAGPGLGVAFNVPFGESGLHLFSSARVSPMFLDYSAEAAPDNAVQWHYDLGLGYGVTVGQMERGNVYCALGYRYQQMRGSDLDERVGAPFFEAGFRQMF